MKKYILLLCVALLALFSTAFAETETAARTDGEDPFEFVHKLFFPMLTPEDEIINAFEPFENENESLKIEPEGNLIDGSYLNLVYNRKSPIQCHVYAAFVFEPENGLVCLTHRLFIDSPDDSIPDMIWKDVESSGLYTMEDVNKEMTEYFKVHGGRKSFVGEKDVTSSEDITDVNFRNLILNQTFTKNENYSLVISHSGRYPFDDFGTFDVYDGNDGVRLIEVDTAINTEGN